MPEMRESLSQIISFFYQHMFSNNLRLFCDQKAAELDMGIFVHPWDMQLDGRMQQYWLPWLVGKYTGSHILVTLAHG